MEAVVFSSPMDGQLERVEFGHRRATSLEEVGFLHQTADPMVALELC